MEDIKENEVVPNPQVKVNQDIKAEGKQNGSPKVQEKKQSEPLSIAQPFELTTKHQEK